VTTADDFPIGTVVEPSNEGNAMVMGVTPGTRGVVVYHSPDGALIGIQWENKPYGGLADQWCPARFKHADDLAENVKTKLPAGKDLKLLNSRPAAKSCAACGTLLKEPYPGIKYCPTCEP